MTEHIRQTAISPTPDDVRASAGPAVSEELLRETAAELCHDLNNALAGVFGYMDMARELLASGRHARAQESLAKAMRPFSNAKAIAQRLHALARGGRESFADAAAAPVPMAHQSTASGCSGVEPSARPARQGRATVLVLDDEPSVLDIVHGMLELSGYSVATARSGEEALRLVSEAREAGKPYAAAIVDIMLPGSMNGIQTAAALRAEQHSMPIIVTSGHRSEPAMVRPHEYGFVAAVPKPFTCNDLLRALTAVT